MKSATSTINGVTITTVTHTSDVFLLKLSVDMHQAHSVHTEAVEYLYSDMLLSGAGAYSRDEFLHALNSLGARISVTVEHSILTITLSCLDAVAPEATKLLHTLLAKPTFPAKELQRVQTVSINELHEYTENARGRARDELANTLYSTKDRRHSSSLAALKKALTNVTTKDLKNYHKLVLKNEQFLTIGGKSKTVTNAVNSFTNIFTTEAPATNKAHEAKQLNVPTVELVSIPSKTNVEFSIGGPLPITRSHPDFPALLFGFMVLGKWGGFAGRLMSTVREKEGLTYGIYARFESQLRDELGYWRIMTFFAPEKATIGVSSTLREIKQIIRNGITNTELKRFKDIITTTETLQHDSLKKMVERLHGLAVQGISAHEYEAFLAAIEQLKVADVNQALKQHVDLTQLVIAGAGPTTGLQTPLEKLL